MSKKPENAVLLSVLKQETESLIQFIAWLTREQEDLRQAKTDELTMHAEQKDMLINKLGKLAIERDAWLIAQQQPTGRKGMDTWCATHPEEREIVSAWSAIILLVVEARELNRLNGELINIHMQHNTQALEVLRRGDNPLDLYGPDGKSSPPPGMQRISITAD